MRFKYELLTGSGAASTPDDGLNVDDLKTCKNGCMLCKTHLNTSTVFKSTVTNQTFSLPKGNYGIDVACTTKNVVYLVTCDHCSMQYVGMTTNDLRARFTNHRSSVRNGKFNTGLYYHCLCAPQRDKAKLLQVQIIYRYDKLDDAKDVLLTVEEFFMRKLCTLMPFGLNDNISSMNINLSSYNFVNLHRLNTPFFSFPSLRKKRGHGHRKNSKRVSLDNIRAYIDRIYELIKNFKVHDLYILLRSMSRHTINDCLMILDDFCSNHQAKLRSVSMIILSFNSQYVKPPKTKEDSFIYCNIPFIHKVIENLGIRDIFRCKEVHAHLPHSVQKYKIRLTYSYGPTTGKKIFNYNKTLNSLTNEDLSSEDCDCREKYAKFIYAPHGHVHTGQLDIIKNKELREVMAMGAKYRLAPSVTKKKIWTNLEKIFLLLKKKIARQTKIKEDCLVLWYEVLIKKLKKRFFKLKNYEIESNDIFEHDEVIQYLDELHDRFVIVPVDKASHNFAIICKAFYIKILKNELGIKNKDDISGNAVYLPLDITEEEFYSEQEQTNIQLGNTLKEKNRNIPLLYWTSKQHKNPYKFRFIAGASHCTNKTISLEVSLALKCIKTHFKNYCRVIKKNIGLNFFWSIDNSIEFLEKTSGVDFADSIETFDFSTLYTNLPLGAIYHNLEKLIIKMFRNSGSNSILVNANRRKAFWSQNSRRAGYKEYTIGKLLDALKFVLYNTYVKFGDIIFKQIQGIPMGGNASPFIADLYLAWNEYCYMERLSKSKTDEDKILAEKLSNNSRYIDDIAVINFLGFGNIAKDIYHPSLVLESSGFGYHFDTFLDVLIRIHNKKFIIGIYHKVDDFDFEVINFPFPSSNIHSETGYISFYSQLVRFFRLCNNATDFVVRVGMIRQKLCVRGYEEKTLNKYFRKFCNQYPVVRKFCAPDGDFLWNITMKSNVKFCNVLDEKSIKNIIKPSMIMLKDMYSPQKRAHSNILKDCFVNLDINPIKETSNLSKEIHSTEFELQPSYTEDSRPVRPLAINNPLNHCYLNSVLQVLIRILSSSTHTVQINNNMQGCLTRELCNFVTTQNSEDLYSFKKDLAKYDTFFDGLLQRDALQCLFKLIDILNLGTRNSILDVDEGSYVNEDFFISLSKNLFTMTLNKTLECNVCQYKTSHDAHDNLISIYPENQSSISDLLEKSFISQITKHCVLCTYNTLHLEKTIVHQNPDILVLVVNRYDPSALARKNKSSILINRELHHNSIRYALIGSIHHLGNSTTSGHYICKLNYDNVCYLCNDHIVSEVTSADETSDNAYIIFYKASNG